MFYSKLIEKAEQIEGFLENDLSREVFKYRLLGSDSIRMNKDFFDNDDLGVCAE